MTTTEAEDASTTLASQLALRETEITTLREENVLLNTQLASYRKKEIDARVTDAITTYSTKKGLTEKSRKLLTQMCSTMREDFEREYPQVPQEHRHLLVNHTERGSKAPLTPSDDELPKLSLADIATQISAEKNIPFDRAMLEAERIIEKATRK